jgi:hypothetical protein
LAILTGRNEAVSFSTANESSAVKMTSPYLIQEGLTTKRKLYKRGRMISLIFYRVMMGEGEGVRLQSQLGVVEVHHRRILAV